MFLNMKNITFEDALSIQRKINFVQFEPRLSNMLMVWIEFDSMLLFFSKRALGILINDILMKKNW